jgi:chromosome segregation ATPase
MAENELMKQIKEKEEQIKMIEDHTLELKKNYKKELDEKYNPKIAELESKIRKERNDLEIVYRNYNELKNNEKEIKKKIKSLNSTIKIESEAETINELKVKDLKSQLESEKKKLGKTIAEYQNWNIESNVLKNKIKDLDKDIKLLYKVKDKLLNKKLNEIISQKKVQSKPIESELKSLYKMFEILGKTSSSKK